MDVINNKLIICKSTFDTIVWKIKQEPYFFEIYLFHSDTSLIFLLNYMNQNRLS